VFDEHMTSKSRIDRRNAAEGRERAGTAREEKRGGLRELQVRAWSTSSIHRHQEGECQSKKRVGGIKEKAKGVESRIVVPFTLRIGEVSARQTTTQKTAAEERRDRGGGNRLAEGGRRSNTNNRRRKFKRRKKKNSPPRLTGEKPAAGIREKGDGEPK